MKYFFPFVIFITVTFSLKAQQINDDSATFFKAFRYNSISIKNLQANPIYTFKQVTVLDNRPDTSYIGFYRTPFVLKNALSLVKNESLQTMFSSQLQNDTSNDKILIVVNHLNIQNIPSSDVQQLVGIKFPEYAGFITYAAKIYLNVDSFYIPLVKIDTEFITKKIVANASEDLLESVLSYTAKVAGELIRDKVFIKRMHLSKEQLLTLNTPYPYSKNIATDTTSGIYLTFNDFLNHRLTKSNFRLELFKEGCYYIYIKQADGTEYLTRNLWGACNNGRNFIMNYGFLFPLYRCGNSFYWNGFFQYRDKSVPVPFMVPVGSATAYGISSIRTGFKLTYTPYILNMVRGNQF